MSIAKGFSIGFGAMIGALVAGIIGLVVCCGGWSMLTTRTQERLEQEADAEAKAIGKRPMKSVEDFEQMKRDWRQVTQKDPGTKMAREIEDLLTEREFAGTRDKTKTWRQRVRK